MESNLLLTTEFNYNYRIFDGVWASYVEKPGEKPLGFNGVQLNKTDAKGNVKSVRYITFAEHPEHDNEFAYSLASECALD